MIKLPVFKKKKCSYLYNSFVPLQEILFSNLNYSKNCKIFLGLCYISNPRLYLKQTKLVRLRLALLGFFPICNNIFPVIDQCRFCFTSGIGPGTPMNVLEDCIIFLIWAAWVLFTFRQEILRHFNIAFQPF